ncbi:mucin-5AC-like [Anopheles marshallii]|uniref:mucin-5AC-like n=1 Tax=Anopheles marshallii TaxID=1521116 RepID=UPI00237BFE3F|nr:mucin-5AC-like [Anopheles marshallii]
MNTTTMLESCSPIPPEPPALHAPWWSVVQSDSGFPALPEDGCDVRALVPGKGRVDVGRNRATTGERSLGDARKTAADVCRIEFDTTTSFSGAETSVTVHDVCNKTIRSSSSSSGNDSNRGCGGQFSSGARSHVASGSCNGSGTVAAASPSGAAVANLGQQQHQQHQSNSPKKPCDYSSISDSSSSNSNRGGTVFSRASGSRPPFAASTINAPALAAAGTGGHPLVTAPTPTLPDIDWTNETCLAGGLDFTNTIVDDPRHLWLSSPTASSSSSNITDTELDRTLDVYHRAVRGQSKPIETRIDCADLLDELHVELTDPPLTISSPVSLHEEIEQLSSAFDCDASNHLVLTGTPATTTHPFVGLTVDETEPISLNILKWLQEDISSNSVPTRSELCSTSTELVESLLVDTTGAATHLFLPSQPISTHPSTFEQSLDQIHNITGLTRGISKTTTTAAGRRIGDSTATATANSTTTATTTTTTTSTTHNTANQSQRDHNYYAMKRRMQEEDGVREGTPTKVSKLLQPTGAGWVADDAKFSTPSTSGLQAATGGDGKQPHLHAKPSATNTVAGAMGRKLSLANRKATTLAVNVTPRVNAPAGAPAAVVVQQQPSSTITHATALNTPDLTNDILDLEDEKFDLLSFIDTNDDALEFSSYSSTVEEKPTLDLLAPTPSVTCTERHKTPANEDERLRPSTSKATLDTTGSNSSKGEAEKEIYHLLTLDSLRQLTSGSDESTSRAATATGGRRTNTSSACSIGSRSSASSVCGDSSSDVSSSNKTPKRRGRPPKVASTVRDRSQYQHLSDADWRYREQRDKNNEASRKSRINRKDRELKLEMEADQLSAQHQKLSYEERRLQQECQRWRRAVMKLALL